MIFNKKGFTLVELMIAVAIVGILAAIAVPSYKESVRKARRADAKGALMGLSNAMERRYTEKNTYKGNAAGGADTGAPSFYPTKSPVDGGPKYYSLTISAADDSSFTLQATPITTSGSGDSSDQAADKCGTLQVDNTGLRNILNYTSGVTVTDCW